MRRRCSDKMLTETQTKSILRNNDFRPNKLLGQNFLVDKNMQAKILNNCELAKDDVVLEIGAGLGALTLDIAGRVRRVFAVEKDKRLSAILKEHSGSYYNLDILTCDILGLNIEEIAGSGKLKIIGNLPYSATSPILSHILENKKYANSVFVTVQREVGMRLVARPGSRGFGNISVYVQFHTEPHLLFRIPKGVFYPKPAVDSVFIKLDILKEPRLRVKDEALFFKIARAAFNKRRKTILNALSDAPFLNLNKKDTEQLLRKAHVDPLKRPEQLLLEDFASISDSIA